MRSCPKCSRIQADSMGFCPEDGERLRASDPLLGHTLSGQYLLQERIGQGACGDVYRAHQFGVERQVAVKVLHAGAAQQREFSTRFAREARAAAQLSHPNIVTVFQLGESAAGQPYIAMEWADASPIGRQGEPLDHAEILDAAKQMASALAEAHDAGIIHRDLKPENVLVGRRAHDLHVTLVDFGIAKIVNADLLQSGETHLTRQGVVYGTPQYLSPEQAGDQPIDARSDLYSLGVMLYELFAGRLPFESQGMALLVDHLTTTPVHVSRRAPDIDPEFASLIMQLLEKKPSRRPASARVVLARLRALGASQTAPVLECLPRPRVHRPRTGLGLMVALMLWLASSGSLGTMPRAHADVTAANSATPAAASSAASANSSASEEGGALASARNDVASEAATDPVASVSQRALLLSSSGYSLRVLVPEYLGANEEHALAVELWDAAGTPVRSPALVLVFTDESGNEQGVSVPASSVPGRYEIRRRFEHSGTHAMRVLPEDPGVALRLHFEVEPEGAPNT